jgi:hypothetical protein
VADAWTRANTWEVVSLDPEVDLSVVGDQPLTGWSEGKPASLSTSATLGASAPTVQWTAGGLRTVQCTTALVARDFNDDVGPVRDRLRALNERDPILGRALRVRFTWGTETIAGFVEVKTTTTTHLPNGRVLRVEVEFSITEAELPSRTPASGETTYRVLRQGETFERLALVLLGDASKGDLVRRMNPAVAAAREAAGVRVRVLEPFHPAMRGKPAPVSPAFQGATWQDTVDALAVDLGTTVRGRSWRSIRAEIGG